MKILTGASQISRPPFYFENEYSSTSAKYLINETFEKVRHLYQSNKFQDKSLQILHMNF
jgi:hypothetical protein